MSGCSFDPCSGADRVCTAGRCHNGGCRKDKKMEAPAQITLENLGFGQLQISWTAVEGATYYRVYRAVVNIGEIKVNTCTLF